MRVSCLCAFCLLAIIGPAVTAGPTSPAPASASADPATPADVLKRHRLTRSRSIYVLDDESEVQHKLSEVASLFRELNDFFLQRMAYLNDEAEMKVLEERRSSLRRDINDLNVLLGRFPRRMNSVQRGQYNTLRNQRDNNQLEIDDVNRNAAILRNRAPSGREKRDLEAEIEKRRPAYLEAVHELRKLVDATRSQYTTLAKDPEVKHSLEHVPQPGGARLTLGPTAEFLTAVKQLKQLESVFPPESTSKAARPPREKPGSKVKR